MKVWAIREIASGNYLPLRVSGQTWSEPDTKEKPRLFYSKRSAQNALTFWCQGRFTKKKTGGWATNSFALGDDYEEWNELAEKRPDNTREKMEIVEFELAQVH